MIHRLSYWMTIFFLQNDLIRESDYEWCLYVVEKKLLQGCFLFATLFCSLISGQFPNVLTFMSTVYFLRSRIGGWHAPYNLLCVILTIIITLFVTFKFGPVLLNINMRFVWIANGVLFIIAFLLKPIYPERLHFQEAIIQANYIKKNIYLICILFTQTVFFSIGIKQVLVFSFSGILLTILLVILEQLKQSLEGD